MCMCCSFKTKIIKTTDSEFKSLQDLMDNYNFIGFVPEKIKEYPEYISERYIVVLRGPAMGLAVNHKKTWADEQSQKDEQGTYFLFNSKKELYNWMIGDENI